MINKTKYASSLIISMIGSEAFKLGTAIYIYKFTSSFWLVSLLYLLIQIPVFISYLLNKKIASKLKLKNILIATDFISVGVLMVILISSFFFIKNNSLQAFSIFLLITNIILNIIHSFRFIALKSVLYYLSNNNKDIKTYNVLATIATALAFLLASVFSFVLFTKLPFWSLIVMNMITYLASGILYFILKLNKEPLQTTPTIKNNVDNLQLEHNKNYNIWKWVYTIACSLIVGIFLFPRTAGMSQFFKAISFNAEEWSFILNIIFGSFGLIGSLISLVIRNKDIKLKWILLAMNIVILIVIPILFISISNYIKNIIYLVIIGMQQLFFSLFIAIFYTNTYLLFKEDKFKKNTIWTLIFKVISSSLIILLLTLITYQINYFVTFTVFAALILVTSIVIAVSEIFLSKHKKKEMLIKKQQANK
ncbi:hypothetical protein ACT1UH_03215 [Mycoplasma sp. 332]|uniref:hypothetical protein n=1 Tax=Mycoplasma sp. 332 TaxID=3458236 RepID=UPI004035FFB8